MRRILGPWVAGVLLACAANSHAGLVFSSELGPGDYTGYGNIAFWSVNHFSVPFSVRWYGSPVPVSERFVDLTGEVAAVGSRSGLPGTYEFTSVTLYSLDQQAVLDSVLVPDGAGEIDFTFGHLAEGAYRLDVTWQQVPPDPTLIGGYQEWGYRLEATASPVPEAADLALWLLGLGGVGGWVRLQTRKR